MKLRQIISVLFLATIISAPAVAQDRPTEKLNASRIQARATRGLRAQRPHLGLPIRIEGETVKTNTLSDLSYAEKISVENGIWTSMNPDLEIPNWVAWDVDLSAIGRMRDPFPALLKDFQKNYNPDTWNLIMEECNKWAWDKPTGNMSVVCGSLVYADEVAKGKNAVPYEYFVVFCKKVAKGPLGWKSIGFLIPNNGTDKKGVYSYSTSVNIIEYKSGYNFFKLLPENLQEVVEGMTTYELFCSFVEDDVYQDDPSERMEDFNDMISDYLEDIHDR